MNGLSLVNSESICCAMLDYDLYVAYDNSSRIHTTWKKLLVSLFSKHRPGSARIGSDQADAKNDECHADPPLHAERFVQYD
jgi:hypothetical protein